MPALDLAAAVRADPPFPGLRPFERHESHLFFGREAQVGELLSRLGSHRFLAVVGTSGSGKSSLVRAGLLPSLYSGYLVGATSRWRIAILRPGRSPIAALAEALRPILGEGPSALGETLRSSSHGLLDAVASAQLPPGEAVLLVVDQFEELFRFADERAGRAEDDVLFVSLLLQASLSFQAPVYVILTMRSDFLGDCARFDGLSEALNRSQYLVPRLTRDQRERAIELPLLLAGAEAEPGLVQVLLNDSGDDPDQLPVLQHVLLRTYLEWKRAGAAGRLAFRHYEDAGRMAGALDAHAEDVVRALGATRPDRLVERVLRCLTTVDGNRMVRRPARLSRLRAVAGAEAPELERVLDVFCAPENSLLVRSDEEDGADPVIDISHESLIRQWRRLGEWVTAETKSAEWYRDLVRDVERGAALWPEADVARVETLRDEEAWNAAWAEQYVPLRPGAFPGVEAFIRSSRRQLEDDRRRAEDERERETQRQREALEAAQQLSDARRQALEAAELAADATEGRLAAQRRARTWYRVAVGLLAVLLAGGIAWRIRDVRARAVDAKNAQAVATYSEQLTALRSQQAQLLQERLRALESINAAPADHNRTQLEDKLRLLQESYDRKVQEASEAQRRLQQSSQAAQSGDQATLAKQVADLQQQLKQAQQQRDAAQRTLEGVTASQQQDATYWKGRVAQMEAATSGVVVLPQSSYLPIENAPFNGGVWFALGDLRRKSSATAQVYLIDGKPALSQAPFRESEPTANGVLAQLARQTRCPGRSKDGRIFCFVADRRRTMIGQRLSESTGAFVHDGQRYDVTSVAWTQNAQGGTDVLTLLFTPAAAPPSLH